MKECYCNCVCARGKRVQDLEARVKELEMALQGAHELLAQWQGLARKAVSTAEIIGLEAWKVPHVHQ